MSLVERPKLSTQLVGAAGEYHIAAELSTRGWIATVTVRSAPGTDLLAEHADSGDVVIVQSKTSRGKNFQLRGSAPAYREDLQALLQHPERLGAERPARRTNEWFVFVGLSPELNQRPEFFVVPRNVIAAALWANHLAWLARPGRYGSAHKDGMQRVIRRTELRDYEDQWEWLHRPTDTIPTLLEQRWRDDIIRFGYPPGHPGLNDLAAGKQSESTAKI